MQAVPAFIITLLRLPFAGILQHTCGTFLHILGNVLFCVCHIRPRIRRKWLHIPCSTEYNESSSLHLLSVYMIWHKDYELLHISSRFDTIFVRVIPFHNS